jgi:predicted nucleic acid-binding protein
VIRYLDTSALAKRYVDEPGSTVVRAVVRKGRIGVARVTHAELLATLARAWREGLLDEEQRDALFDRVEVDFKELIVVEVRPAIVRRVRDLVTRHPLRGYDAIQLAAALALRDEGAPIDFWSADGRLVAAARSEGLRATVPGASAVATRPRHK